MRRTAFARRGAADHLGAVGDRLLGVERAVLASEALADHFGVLVDENSHVRGEDEPFHSIHHVAGGDDRPTGRVPVVDVALLHAVGRHQRDPEVAVHVAADDRLVVARNRPGERLLGVGSGRRRASPGNPSFLAFNHMRPLDVAHTRRTGGGLLAGMMGMGAEHDRLALSRPCALQIGNCILRVGADRGGAKERQCEYRVPHRLALLLE